LFKLHISLSELFLPHVMIDNTDLAEQFIYLFFDELVSPRPIFQLGLPGSR
jgi:hypothetical protein